jgi:uncharacterized protein
MPRDIQPILRELKAALQELYGERLKGLYLFGSYARGEAREDSDIDVAMVLDDFDSANSEISRTGALVADLSLEHECVVSLIPVRESDLRVRRSPLLLNLRREGAAV